MKKIVCLILIAVVVIISIFFMNFKEDEIKNINVNKFNLEYEYFNKKSLNGLEVASVINMAIDNNETLNIKRNEKGFYILDDEKSIEIYINLNTEDTYKMETLYGLGMKKFVEAFGSAEFECTSIEYHESTKRIASMTFEAKEY